jgi:hypothetical protein
MPLETKEFMFAFTPLEDGLFRAHVEMVIDDVPPAAKEHVDPAFETTTTTTTATTTPTTATTAMDASADSECIEIRTGMLSVRALGFTLQGAARGCEVTVTPAVALLGDMLVGRACR